MKLRVAIETKNIRVSRVRRFDGVSEATKCSPIMLFLTNIAGRWFQYGRSQDSTR